MLRSLIPRTALYLKEFQEIGLFAVMSNSRYFYFFTGTPLYYEIRRLSLVCWVLFSY